VAGRRNRIGHIAGHHARRNRIAAKSVASESEEGESLHEGRPGISKSVSTFSSALRKMYLKVYWLSIRKNFLKYIYKYNTNTFNKK